MYCHKTFLRWGFQRTGTTLTFVFPHGLDAGIPFKSDPGKQQEYILPPPKVKVHNVCCCYCLFLFWSAGNKLWRILSWKMWILKLYNHLRRQPENPGEKKWLSTSFTCSNLLIVGSLSPGLKFTWRGKSQHSLT